MRKERKRKPIAERFWSKVAAADALDCWAWMAAHGKYGHGHFWDGVTVIPAHRWAYEQLIADVPIGLVLDHLCVNPPCVNPWHLEPVTPRVNSLRRNEYFRPTACPHGHPYTPDNIYITPSTGARRCRTCRRIDQALYHLENREQINSKNRARYRI